MDNATKEIQKEYAKRRISFGMRHPSSPKVKEQETELEELPAGAPVPVYREKSKKWEGPFPFVNIQDNTVIVQTSTGRKIFRSTVLKPASHISTKENWRVMTDNTADTHHTGNIEKKEGGNAAFWACAPPANLIELPSEEVLLAMFGAGEHRYATPKEGHIFAESRNAELQGLADRDTFKVVKRSTVPKGIRIYGTRWVDLIKVVDGKEVPKSRLVAQNYRDKGATTISTRSPTVSRMGQRVTVATAALFPEHTSYTRDISQAYIQSNSKLERPVYIQPRPEMGLADDEVLLATKPLYGIPESGLHWFVTYHTYHIEHLEMKPCRSDICVLHRRVQEQETKGVTALQVDDSYGHGDDQYLADEERESKRFQRFKCKPRKLILPGDSADFDGCGIAILEDAVHRIRQDVNLKKLEVPANQEDLISTRALIQYIGSCTRPELCAPAQLLSSAVTKPRTETFSKMRKIVKWCHETSTIGLKFVPLDRKGLRLLLFTDASFGNADRLKSQLGFVVVLVDGTGNGNVLHYVSTTCRRVARSVMAAELHALVYGFENAFRVRDMLSEILGQGVDIDGCVDSRTVFNVVAKTSATLEKRLQIDVNALRQICLNALESCQWRTTLSSMDT